MNMDVILFDSLSYKIIMTPKVYPLADVGARILIKESSIKAIDVHQGLEKA